MLDKKYGNTLLHCLSYCWHRQKVWVSWVGNPDALLELFAHFCGTGGEASLTLAGSPVGGEGSIAPPLSLMRSTRVYNRTQHNNNKRPECDIESRKKVSEGQKTLRTISSLPYEFQGVVARNIRVRRDYGFRK
jgi:hypothetical protein